MYKLVLSEGILVVFPQLLFSILDNWSSILLVPFFTDILYSYLNKGKKEKEHDFCVKSMQYHSGKAQYDHTLSSKHVMIILWS
ncbi:hypothetical protein NC651_035437 [Populus alba x Populus x berolinensis]|nr:hypothetical protein NC651_035437 [Populus alba x Populus x berolinensis]